LSTVLVLLLLAAPAPPEIPVRKGVPITLDARVEEAEWSDAFSITRDQPGGKVRFRMKRTGPWLAMALEGDGPYRGEVLRLHVTDSAGVYVTNVVAGLGQPILPPALWRRGPAAIFDSQDLGPGEVPRGCLVRLDVGNPDRWSAEVLLRLGALGIGKGDLRDLRGFIAVHAYDPSAREVLTLPGGAKDPHDTSQYARLVSEDGWGKDETWDPVTPEETKEFDDAALLFRLCLEHDKVQQREAPDELVISTVVAPRILSRIQALRKELEAARSRNPTLPGWTYFLARLLTESNLYDDARTVIDSIPPPLRKIDAFAQLLAQYDFDIQDFAKARQVCIDNPWMNERSDLIKRATHGEELEAAEREAIAKDEAKTEKNPRVALQTSRGTIVLELFEDDAPAAVRNFMDLVLRRKFYDGLHFSEVVGGHLAIVGDPRARPGAEDALAGPGVRLLRDRSERSRLRRRPPAQGRHAARQQAPDLDVAALRPAPAGRRLRPRRRGDGCRIEARAGGPARAGQDPFAEEPLV
jgi:hypothetical protein